MPNPNARVSIVFTAERYIDEGELTTLTGPPDGGGVVTVMRLTANTRHEGGEYDDEGNPRSFWLRFCAPAYDKPYIVTHWMSRREMRAELENNWGGYEVNADGCDIFSPDFTGEALLLPESCEECDDTGWFIGTGYGNTDPPGPGVILQRCDSCEKFDGDVAAAIDYARVKGGQVHAIVGSYTDDGTPLMAPQSDAWVVPDSARATYQTGAIVGGVVWHAESQAVARGWYTNPETGDGAVVVIEKGD